MLFNSLGVRWKYLQKICSLKETDVKRSDSLSSDTSESIKDFYLRPEISIVLPNAKYVRKGMRRRYLQRSVNSTCKLFKTQYPEKKVGKSKFANIRPKHVKTQKAQRMNECLCQKPEGQKYSEIACIESVCMKCGLEQLKDNYELQNKRKCYEFQFNIILYTIFTVEKRFGLA